MHKYKVGRGTDVDPARRWLPDDVPALPSKAAQGLPRGKAGLYQRFGLPSEMSRPDGAWIHR